MLKHKIHWFLSYLTLHTCTNSSFKSSSASKNSCCITVSCSRDKNTELTVLDVVPYLLEIVPSLVTCRKRHHVLVLVALSKTHKVGSIARPKPEPWMLFNKYVHAFFTCERHAYLLKLCSSIPMDSVQ